MKQEERLNMDDKTEINQARSDTKDRGPVDSTGANAEAYVTGMVNQISTITFREQAENWLRDLSNRRLQPVTVHTCSSFRSANKWLLPVIGCLPLSEINNAFMRSVVAEMSAGGLSPATIKNYAHVAKMVVASARNEDGEELYPRKWNNNYIGMPLVERSKQNTPHFTREIMSGLAVWKFERERTLFILCAASGLRLSEVCALEIDKHCSADFSTLTIEQTVTSSGVEHRVKAQASFRKVDLHPTVATLLKNFAGKRTSGFLFCSSNGTPLHLEGILIKHLHPALMELRFVNPATNTYKAGAHAFRRFRQSQLSRTDCPQSLQRFWMGHADDNWMAAHFNTVHEDEVYRKGWAEKCGLGFELPPAAPSEPEVEGDHKAKKAA